MIKFKYASVRSKQTKQGHWLVQFSAPATEIAQWAGVPQKKRFLDDDVAAETVGFQRGEDSARVRSLGRFLEASENVVQNPLLCSLRTKLDFVKRDREGDENVEVGDLIVGVPDFDKYSVEDCLRGVREYLERRVPELRGQEPDEKVVEALKARLADSAYEEVVESSEGAGYEDMESENHGDEIDDIEATGALHEESLIRKFWQEIAARHVISKEINPVFDQSKFLGFSRDALLSYLRPVVLVDGQHRLLGALYAANVKLNDDSTRKEVENRISAGESAEEVEKDILRRESRLLPVSLLMSDSAEEQVFQFVVVNQKATPVGRALLGTIISTTLSNSELERVASRLKSAGIPLEESRAVSFMAVREESPFFDRVDRGLGGQQDGLQWNVLASLITIFRDLRGGRLFGQSRDWAAAWQRMCLDESTIVEDYVDKGFENPFEYWRDFDGPWRHVFIVFWKKIRDKFANVTAPETPNYWGRPRTSNLFNKISLIILAADFFQFLVDRRLRIKSEGEIEELVDDWLANVSDDYFNRDWKLSGIKKDVSGIRNQWADVWEDYRKVGGRLPASRKYRMSQNG